ncbi:hypothetical protein [Leptolyngbya sp. CCY15150]|uniref:hypothetical protein n=1 Tax=Leptolyngbya sp. CCY15150 TaxID=2767772 RepID=UPI00194ED64A|nr:hypothetical protein [Leptolyngbya sp. CCY15150]
MARNWVCDRLYFGSLFTCSMDPEIADDAGNPSHCTDDEYCSLLGGVCGGGGVLAFMMVAMTLVLCDVEFLVNWQAVQEG